MCVCIFFSVNKFCDWFYLVPFIGLIEIQKNVSDSWMKHKENQLENQTDLKFKLFGYKKNKTQINSIDFRLNANANFIYIEYWTNRKSNRQDYGIKYHFFLFTHLYISENPKSLTMILSDCVTSPLKWHSWMSWVHFLYFYSVLNRVSMYNNGPVYVYVADLAPWNWVKT